MRRVAAVVCLLVLAGCAAPAAQPNLRDGWQWPEDPPTDRIGFESGVWWNESIDVNQSDGLSAAERRAFVARTSARVERLRGLEFTATVPVEVISRAEYRNRSVFAGDRSAAYHSWRNQVWEAALVVGEDRNATDAFAALYGGAVQGYYSPRNDRIVVVSDADEPVLDRATLAHELLHALQDQHFGFTGAALRDVALAHDGLTEGDARYVETLYEERCAANRSEWRCVPRPAPSAGGGGAPVNQGLFTYIYQPYADGPQFVHRLRERGGWAAVNAAYDDRPVSTEQTIHPDAYPAETPTRIRPTDRSSDGWSRFDLQQHAERLGETGVFTMLWYQRYVDRGALTQRDGAYSPYDYSHPASAGWAGDRLVPYRSGSGADARYGYVWTLRWDSSADAAQFASAYRTVLTEQLGAETVRTGVYRVPSGPFADAFRVERRGDTVVVTNAPTVDALSRVRAPAE
ncbi:Hvo_1808 family surface protein [Halobaculum sp. P14]|uniref:Hvo_1808 family surface protein n=1 Tax=Halobaculum sp. P14 TaxID=3421638 RepID=UPI003EB6FAF2